MKKRTPAQLALIWENQSSLPVKKEQGFQWHQLICKKGMSAHEKRKFLWDLADTYETSGKRQDWYKVERWAKDMGNVLIERETSLWEQYQKAFQAGNTRAVDYIETAHDETINMMELFDSMLDLDFQESKVS
jgi:hypothetical protein